MAEERAKAEAEKHAEKIEMARKFLKMGLPAEQVAVGTGLTVSDIAMIEHD